jgi:hypothetical protein
MTDEVSARGKRVDHDCVHVTTEISYTPFNSGVVSEPHFVDGVNLIYPFSSISGFGMDFLSGDPGSLPAGTGFGLDPQVDFRINDLLSTNEVQDVLYEHTLKVSRPISQQISLANFLLELEDIKRSLDFVRKKLADRRLGNDTLAYNLGLKPLIGDMRSIAQYPYKLIKQLEWLKRNIGKPVRILTTRNFKNPVIDEEEAVLPGTYDGGSYLKVAWAKEVPNVEVKCVTWVTYDFGDVNDALLTCYAIADSLGFSNPLKIVWNAIPYSFVVDWFSNVSRLLDGLDFGGKYLSRAHERSTTHIKCGIDAACKVSLFNAYNSADNFPLTLEKATVQRVNATLYRRWVGIPLEFNLLGNSSLRELMLSLFLALQLKPFNSRLKKFTQGMLRSRWGYRVRLGRYLGKL